jgi:Secretion system C-terminal sorting domain
MRKIGFWAVFLIAALDVSAQSISNKVLPSGGGSSTKGNVQLSFTIGETMIPTLSTGKNIITQGFQQPGEDNSTSLRSYLELSTFDAYPEYRTAKLLFMTNTGFKTDYLVLERLNNETGEYDALEYRNSIANTDELTQYSFNDNSPQDDDNFYRIKSIRVQGDSVFTEVKKLNFDKSGIISVFPNPATEFLMLDLSTHLGKDATISIFNEMGQAMYQQKVESIGKGLVRVPLDAMDSGNYQINIAVKGKRNFIKKFIVTK